MTDLATVYRESRAGLVASIARRLGGDLGRAEDAVQEAFARASVRWPVAGAPERPAAWLATVAWRCALDAVRRDGRLETLDDTRADRIDHSASTISTEDEQLGLILACCHPALAVEDRLVLTLRHVAGLTEEQIASGLLATRGAIAKRLVRARRKIRDGGISLDLAASDNLEPRIEISRAVILLVFNAGYLTNDPGPVVRDDLCDEAVWLARQMHQLMPRDPETTALLALLLLHSARRSARLDGSELVPFASQDADRWDNARMQEAEVLLAATGHRPPGPMQLQAAIVVVQMLAVKSGRPVPWQHVARLYDALARITHSPIVELNRAVAVSHGRSVSEGLEILQRVSDDRRLREHPPFYAAHADLLERNGDIDQAAAAWRQALEHTSNLAQRRRIAERLRGPEGPDALRPTQQTPRANG